MSRSLLSSLRRLNQVRFHIRSHSCRTLAYSTTMDQKTKQLYLADAPPSVVKLEIRPHFEALTDKQKRYAHHISRLAKILPSLCEHTGLQRADNLQGLFLWYPCYTASSLP